MKLSTQMQLMSVAFDKGEDRAVRIICKCWPFRYKNSDEKF